MLYKRNCSYSFVHNKTRNPFSLARATNVVYDYTNLWLAQDKVDWNSVAWYLMNMISKDSYYSIEMDTNNDPLARHGMDSLGLMSNDYDGEHGGVSLDYVNPNYPLHLTNDAMDDNELHMWPNIIDQQLVLNMNVHPTMPTTATPIVPTTTIPSVTTTTISIVLVELEPKCMKTL